MNKLPKRHKSIFFSGMLNKIDKLKVILLLIIGVTFFTNTLSASISILYAPQQNTLTGRVIDENGEPVVGATIAIHGTTNGTISNINGNFSLKVGNKDVLVISCVGYIEQTFNISGRTNVEIVLRENVKALDEVVVVGYGKQKKGGATVAVDKVNMDDMLKAPVKSFDEALAGRIAGVHVVSSDGQPGAQTNIVIRGNTSLTQSNSPLYIIDGFPLEDADNNQLDPNSIESIDILKDASATAIYGSRGANGVILITTKRGVIGAPKIDINASYGMQRPAKIMDMMSPYDFVSYQLESNTSTISGSPTDVYLVKPERTLEDYKLMKGINWQDLVLKDAPMMNLSVSIIGGNQNTKYSVLGNLLSQDGVLINSNYSRYQGRFTLDQVINKKLNFGLTSNYTFTSKKGIAPSENTGSASTFMMYNIWGYRPVTGNEDLNLEESLFDPTINSANDYRVNPYINLTNLHRLQKIKTFYSNAYLEYKIAKGLKIRMTGGVTSYNRTSESFDNSNTQWGNAYSTYLVNGSVNLQETNTWINENILSYEKSLGNHNFVFTGVTSAQASKTSVYGFSSSFLPNESLGLSGLDEGTIRQPISSLSEWSLLSFVGRINYDYNSIYYLTTSFRADGSSKFVNKNRWGYFPTVSVAWRFSNEEFIKGSEVLSNGKLRIGYGINGNNKVGDFVAYSSIEMPIAMKYTVNNTPTIGAGPVNMGNDNLRWETTKEINVGLDLGFIKEKISATIDVYRKKTSDLLLRADLPFSSGYKFAQKNVGVVQNEGLEITLNFVNFNQKNFGWSTNFNIAFNNNKILSLNDGQEYMLSVIPWDSYVATMPAYIAKVGNQIGQMYGFISDGLYQIDDFDVDDYGKYILKEDITTNGNTRSNIQPGDIKYKDLNNDKVVNSLDYTEIGNGFPIQQGGLGNNLRYKNFDLNVFFQWSYGNDVLNVNNMFFNGNFLNRPYLNQFSSYNDRWSLENQDAKYHRANGYFGSGYSSNYVEDASYLRLKTISLGFNFSKKITRQLDIDRFRIYLSAQNIFTWTKYSGVDPEVNTYNSALTPGFDWSAYPRAKTLTLGANITL